LLPGGGLLPGSGFVAGRVAFCRGLSAGEWLSAGKVAFLPGGGNGLRGRGWHIFSKFVKVKITQLTTDPLASISTTPHRKSFQFTYLPAYAKYLRDHRLVAFSRMQMETARDHGLPMLKLFEHFPEDEIYELFNKNSLRLLEALESGDLDNYVATAVNAWTSDRLPGISRHQIVSDDVSVSIYMRRKALRGFITDYTQDIGLMCKIIEESDRYLTEIERLLYAALISISNELNDQAQRISRIGNWLWDRATDSIFWSKELFDIYELEPRRPLRREEAGEFNHPEDKAMVLVRFQEAADTGAPLNFHYRIILRSGEEKVLHAMGQAIPDETGTPVKMLGTLQDVTEQYQLERAKAESDLLARKITDLTPSMIGVYNQQTGEYLYVNHAIVPLLGYQPGDLLREGVAFFRDKIHPEDIPRITRESEEAMRRLESQPGDEDSNGIQEYRYRMRHKEGHYRWVQTLRSVFERNKNGSIEKMISLSTDITDAVVNSQLIQQKTEEIARSEERYFRMIDEVEDYAIFLLSTEGIIQNWNRGAEKIKGYTSAEVVGKHFRLFYPEEERLARTPESLISRCVREGKATHEGWRVRKDGSRFWASVVLTALHDDSGRVIGISKVTRDLTAKKMSEEQMRSYTRQLEAKNRELAAKNKELESFTYIASHDLQEPLRKIKLWAGRLEEEGEPGALHATALAKISNSAERMQQLIKGLLNYARMAEVVEWEEVDLDQELRQVLGDYREQLEDKRAAVRYDKLPVVRAVRVQIQQVMANIVSNAIKYAKKDEPLVLDIGVQVQPAHSQHDQPYYEISFSDNGIGFEQEYAEQIFKIFQRLDSGQTPGTGIGLAICRKIAENHQGSIRAESQKGVGTTFILALPVHHGRQ
jgi:PAS domain S-box-containing protein